MIRVKEEEGRGAFFYTPRATPRRGFRRRAGYGGIEINEARSPAPSCVMRHSKHVCINNTYVLRVGFLAHP